MKPGAGQAAGAPPIIPPRRWPLPLVLGLTVLGLAALTLLFLFDPARHALYPACLFKRMTGYDCPGCGGLRAVHQLLHGDVARAFRLNAMVTLGLPALALFWGAAWIRFKRAHPHRRDSGLFWAWVLILLVVLFGLVRNLPFWPYGVTPM